MPAQPAGGSPHLTLPEMEPATIPEPAGFSNLSKVEQIRYLQALWDRIAEKPEHINAIRVPAGVWVRALSIRISKS